MQAPDKIKEYLQEHGPSTWSEIQDGTKLSKATLARAFQDSTQFSSTSPPSTLYSVRGGERTLHYSTKLRFIRNMMRELSIMQMIYDRDKQLKGKKTAEANAEVNLHKLLGKYTQATGHINISEL